MTNELIKQLTDFYNSFNRPMDSFIAEEMASKACMYEYETKNDINNYPYPTADVVLFRTFYIQRNYDRLMKGEVIMEFINQSTKKKGQLYQPVQLKPEMLVCGLDEPKEEDYVAQYDSKNEPVVDEQEIQVAYGNWQKQKELVLFEGMSVAEYALEGDKEVEFVNYYGVRLAFYKEHIVIIYKDDYEIKRNPTPHQLHELGVSLSENAIKQIIQ